MAVTKKVEMNPYNFGVYVNTKINANKFHFVLQEYVIH